VQNHLQVNARLVQQHISSATGKFVSLKDIHNIKARQAKVGSNEWLATVQELDKFQQQDPGAIVEVLVKDGSSDLEMIILQSSQMQENLRNFPEVIQMDGTYGLNQAGLPLYALVIEDSNGEGKLGALILTKGETAISIETMLQRIKWHNPEVNKTRVVIVDKDFAEVNAIKATLPDAQIQLCVFHVLKAIRKELLRSVPKEAQRDVYSIVHGLVYSRNADQFDKRWSELSNYTNFASYMTTNWLPIKTWWVYYERASHINLGNTTNNRIESQFGKIKHVLNRKRRLNECVRLLVAVLQCADVQGKFTAFRNMYKVTYRNGFVGEGDGYFDLCTPYAAKHIIQHTEGRPNQICHQHRRSYHCSSNSKFRCDVHGQQ